MALFKPVIGDSSRISLETTPFHEGWVYFTTDGFLYFDVNVGTEENAQFISGVCNRKDDLLILIDLTKLFTETEWKEVTNLG